MPVVYIFLPRQLEETYVKALQELKKLVVSSINQA